MIQQSGIITGGSNGHYRVSVQRQSSCSTCQTQSKCGVSALDGLRRQSQIELSLESDQDLKIGQTVQLGIAEGAVIKASLLAYALPVLLLLIVSGTAQSLGLSTGLTLLYSAVSLIGGFFLARLLGRRSLQNLQPRMLDGMSTSACSATSSQS